jgi:hypothetical protein
MSQSQLLRLLSSLLTLSPECVNIQIINPRQRLKYSHVHPDIGSFEMFTSALEIMVPVPCMMMNMS